MSKQKKQDNLIQSFEPIIVDTKNVVKELKTVSSTQKIELKYVDFSLLDVATIFRTNPNEEWESLTEEKKDIFDSDDFFIHKELEIFQQYKIEIFDSRTKKENLILPEIKLGANTNITKVVATVKKSLDVRYGDGFEEKLVEDINKKKIRAGILVNIREKDMRRELRRVSSLVRVNEMLEKDLTFVVMEGINYIPATDDDLIFHYKKKINKEDEKGRVDYSKRGYLLPVNEGEIIIEYIKPKAGKPGRTCRGKYIEIIEPKITNNSAINTTEAYTIKEDDNSIKYVACKNGYVKEEKGTFDIQEELELDQVSFRSTGSIEAGLDSNVTINIKEVDEFKDAVGEGMRVETSTLKVDGSVASNASIKTNEVTIGGQTHKTSKIETNKAQVGVHRGTIVGKEISVDRLEGGTIMGDVVRVNSVLGGEIIAKKIYIDLLMSNASLITSELIEIKHVKGNNNKLTVDPARIKGLSKMLLDINQRIENANKEYRLLPKKLELKKNVLDKNRDAVGAIKNKIIELKSKGINPPANLISKLKDYQQLTNEYNLLLKEIKLKKSEIKELKNELDEHQNKIFQAKIINHSSWTDYNEIRFKLISPPVEVLHNTRDGEISREITLGKTTEDDFIIERSAEYHK